ncbi:MAG: hypothetical protein WCR06_10465 [bacterium]
MKRETFGVLFADIKQRTQAAKTRAVLAANSELVSRADGAERGGCGGTDHQRPN